MTTRQQTNRELKATALESHIVHMGLQYTFINSGGKSTLVRRKALEALSYERGSKQTTTDATWDTVLVFLKDRFGRRDG